jgi:hypothetical protein
MFKSSQISYAIFLTFRPLLHLLCNLELLIYPIQLIQTYTKFDLNIIKLFS